MRTGDGISRRSGERAAQEIPWFRTWDRVYEADPPTFRWFVGAEINMAHNAFMKPLSRRRLRNPGPACIQPRRIAGARIFENEPRERTVSFSVIVPRAGGAAIDLPRGIRINAVSPEVLEVCRAQYDGFFPGHVHVSNEAVGLAYSKAVQGCLNGQVFIVD